MTQEDKKLLLKDLCARLPYEVKIELMPVTKGKCATLTPIILYDYYVSDTTNYLPYLRPMSSMTEEEYKELKSISPYYGFAPYEYIGDWCPNYEMINWLNAHHFDYHGLIPMNLALEAPEGMYN